MMQYRSCNPPLHLHPYIGSYYYFTLPDGGIDLMRAKMPNLRFFLDGSARQPDEYGARLVQSPAIELFGPTYHAYRTEFAPGTRIFGAGITPLGWSVFFGLPMQELADEFVALDSVLKPRAMAGAHGVLECATPEGMKRVADRFFGGLVEAHNRKHHREFLDVASRWLLHADSDCIDGLKSDLGLSARQIERLSHRYLGAAPKREQRKYRALIISSRLAFRDDGDWRAATGDSFSDQAHFIREFHEFIGRTPGEFLEGSHLLTRVAIRDLVATQNPAPFGLLV